MQERERKLKERLLKEEEERKKKEQPESALHTLDTVVIKRRWEWDYGYFILVLWIGSSFFGSPVFGSVIGMRTRS